MFYKNFLRTQIKIILISLFATTFIISSPSTKSSAQQQLLDQFSFQNDEEKNISNEKWVQLKQKELLRDIASKKEILTSVGPLEPGQTEAIQEEIKTLENLNLFYDQFLTAQETKKNLKEELKKNQSLLENWSLSSDKQSSKEFRVFDELQDEIIQNKDQIQNQTRKIETLKSFVEELKVKSETDNKKRRLLKEELSSVISNEDNLKKNLAFLEIKKQSEFSHARLLLNEAELENEKIQLKILQVRKQLLEKRSTWLLPVVKFTPNELQKKLEELDKKAKKIETELESHKRKEDIPKSSLTFNGSTLSEKERKSSEVIEAYQLMREEKRQTAKFLTEQLKSIEEKKELWRRRFLIFHDKINPKEISEWKQSTEQSIEQNIQEQQLLQNQLISLQKKLNESRDQLTSSQNQDLYTPQITAAISQKIETLQSQIAIHQDHLSNLYSKQQLYRKIFSEIELNTEQFNFTAFLKNLWVYAGNIWSFEVFSLEDKPFTVGKIFTVLAFFIFGMFIAKRVSRFMGQKMLPKLGMGAGVSLALQTLTFYLLTILIVLLLLNTFSVPLTIFTFFGGALAIGIGFGSQNIVNNFISGLIILIERPIKPGDMVEVDSNFGTVERIGARSTLIRGFNNVHMILPNSDFLEKKVINWNLSDDLVRVFVSVGVAYDSPTRKVSRFMQMAVEEHGLIIKNPEPIILFTEFGDNALIFEVHFWIHMRSLMDRKKIESDIRFRIDSLFREGGITIAYPQRDLHLNTLSPLELKILQEDESSSKAEDIKNQDSHPLKKKLIEKHGHKLKSNA